MEHVAGAVRPVDTFVGRGDELAVLDRAFDEAVSGHPQLVQVEAEPGMGKTALLTEFLARHRDSAAVRRIRCADFEQDLVFGAAAMLLDDDGLAGCSEFEVGRRLLELLGGLQAGRKRCVVLVVDDVQWIDVASARALHFMLRRLRADRVLCLVAGRTAVPSSVDVLADAQVAFTVVRPGPLGIEEVHDLARRARAWEMAPEASERLIRRTGGVPLLVAAVLRGARDMPQLEAGAELPASAASAAARMLGAVDDSAREVAEAAAVLGEPTDLVALGRVASVADPVAAAAAAASGGLVRIDTSGLVECAHALLSEAIYSTLPLVRRRDLHARAAAWTTGDRRLSHRVAAADQPDQALVTDLLDAATAARTAGRYGLAATHRLRARGVTEDPHQRERLLAEALIDRVEAHDLDGAQDLAPAVTRSSTTASRSLALGLLARELRQIGPARTWLADAVDLATGEQDRTLTARAALAAAVLYARLGEGVATVQVLARSRPVEDDPELATDIVTTMALGLWHSGELAQAIDLVSAVETGRNGTPWEAELVAVRGMLLLYAGRLGEALADLDAAVRSAHLWRPSTNQSRIYMLRSTVRFHVGDWDGASVDAAAGRALAQGGAEAWSASQAFAVSTNVPAHRGQWDVAEGHVARAEKAVAEVGTPSALERPLRAAAALAAARGDHGAVLDLLAPAWSDDYLHKLSRVRGSREVMQVRTAAFAQLGRAPEADAALDQYEAMLQMYPEGPVPDRLGWLRGLIAEARAQPRHAREHYARDLADHGLDQVPFLRAQLLLTSGRLERVLGDRREAITRLSQAREILAGLRATPFLARCEAELAACGVQSSGADPLTLTPREDDVTALVLRGYTNKEVAAELFLTAKTVEYHLRNIYAKLGITSRQELRRLAVQRGAGHSRRRGEGIPARD